LVYFSRFGIFYQDESGNPALHPRGEKNLQKVLKENDSVIFTKKLSVEKRSGEFRRCLSTYVMSFCVISVINVINLV
jgi:hypothetical protein